MKTKPTAIASVTCALLAVAFPTVASAAPTACHRPATISSPKGVTDHNFTKLPAANGSFAAPLATRKLHPGHVYQLATASATVRFGGVRFLITGRSVFSLGCFGQVVGGPLLPSLHLQSGSIRVSGSVRHLDGVDTTEALAGPVPGYAHRLVFAVTRTLTTPSQLTEMGMYFDTGGFINAPLGETRVVTDRPGYTNITPYVGSHPGSCRHADGAVLKSTGRKNHNFTGSASYQGVH